MKYGHSAIRDCHSLDQSSGAAGIKIGERNWELRIAGTEIPEVVAPDAE